MTAPLPKADFDAIYARVPRLTVEVVLRGPCGVFLTRRSAGPCAGLWHLPGGTVRFAEPLEEAVSRIALDETGVMVTEARQAGAVEYPSHYLKGLDHPVGVAFTVAWFGEPRALSGADTGAWFGGELPAEMHEEQADLLMSLDDPGVFRAAVKEYR